MNNIEKKLEQIEAEMLAHIDNAKTFGIYEFADILDNYIDCNYDKFECDAMELKRILMHQFFLNRFN